MRKGVNLLYLITRNVKRIIPKLIIRIPCNHSMRDILTRNACQKPRPIDTRFIHYNPEFQPLNIIARLITAFRVFISKNMKGSRIKTTAQTHFISFFNKRKLNRCNKYNIHIYYYYISVVINYNLK